MNIKSIPLKDKIIYFCSKCNIPVAFSDAKDGLFNNLYVFKNLCPLETACLNTICPQNKTKPEIVQFDLKNLYDIDRQSLDEVNKLFLEISNGILPKD